METQFMSGIEIQPSMMNARPARAWRQQDRDAYFAAYLSTRRMSNPPTFEGSIAEYPSESAPSSCLSRRNALARSNDVTRMTSVWILLSPADTRRIAGPLHRYDAERATTSFDQLPP